MKKLERSRVDPKYISDKQDPSTYLLYMIFQLTGDPISVNFHISTICMGKTEIVLVVRK